ncbi:hypothetical protein CKO25_14165 [Thiocapsa imhoffii]|uniref:Class I SAM-dependent methyltransferase n=1 Tax=Thiocapsa imhoffii TaxID=382777 RepID=A0A9X0WJP7_9GAMM|nr:class I SAM-dependent methyltransferase [Thiocapsa imhoffii]MBK1645776.1 hypothetical protein [Thiocapsa imhoffii]
MGEFSAAWLALRAAADQRSRATDLIAPLRDLCARQATIRVLDLGCGTGANMRVLAPVLGGVQAWRGVDADRSLLACCDLETRRWAAAMGYHWDPVRRCARGQTPPFECALRTHAADLTAGPDVLPLAHSDLVTASALLDLVSEAWLSRLVSACAQRGLPMLFVLTYDGRITFDPVDELDHTLVELVNQHQGRDKGFGPALGPAAVGRLEALANRFGYQVQARRSDWQLGAGDAPLQRALIQGWYQAACEQNPAAAPALQAWCSAREEAIAQGRLGILVGHRDQLLMPL